MIFDQSWFLVVFSTFFHVVTAAAIVLTIMSPDEFEIPRDVAEEMDLHVIHNNGIRALSGKRSKRGNDHNADMLNKPKWIKYDHERARKCVQDDWMGPIPHFPDKSFGRIFWITRSMVDVLINHLAKRYSFWQHKVCCAGKPTILPYVKFLTYVMVFWVMPLWITFKRENQPQEDVSHISQKV